jgi:hypothetical protein
MNRTGSAERWRRKEARHDNGKWYYAHLRWAVMVEAKEGLRKWEDAVQIFLSEDRATAFQRTLQIGYEAESCHEEGRGQVENRLAQVISLEPLGSNRTEFHLGLGSSKAKQQLPFEDVFYPEQNEPATVS